MNKKIIALAVALLPAAAMADVTIYGSIRAGLTSTDNFKTNFERTTGVDDFSSRIGFKGNEDLGNGLKAIWKLENGFRVDGTTGAGSSSGTFANRESFVGLQGDFGTLRLGFLDDVLTDTELTDFWIGPRNAGAEMFPNYERADDTVKNAVKYNSPSFGGFDFSAFWGTNETNVNDNGVAVDAKHTYGARAGYAANGLMAGLAYQVATDANKAANKDDKSLRFEVGYEANDLFVAATAQQERYYDGGVDEIKQNAYALSASYTIGQFTPKATYSWLSNDKNSDAKDGSKQFAIGVDYAASKRTTLFAQYGQIKYNSEQEVIKEVNGVDVVTGRSDKGSTVNVGVKHNF